MTAFVEQVISFLEDDSTTAQVDRLFCEVSIEKALKVCTPAEVRIAEERGDQKWLADRQSEYSDRHQALLAHVGNAKVSKATAQMIDEWNASHHYVRPTSKPLISKLTRQLSEADDAVRQCYAARDAMAEVDRFGWDHVNNCEDTEYTSTLEAMSAAEQQRSAIKERLSLAKAGFIHE